MESRGRSTTTICCCESLLEKCGGLLARVYAGVASQLALRERPALAQGTRVHVVRRLAEGGFSFVDLAVGEGGGSNNPGEGGGGGASRGAAAGGRKYALKRIPCGDAEALTAALAEIGVHRAFAAHPNLMPLVDWAAPDAVPPGRGAEVTCVSRRESRRGSCDLV